MFFTNDDIGRINRASIECGTRLPEPTQIRDKLRLRLSALQGI